MFTELVDFSDREMRVLIVEVVADRQFGLGQFLLPVAKGSKQSGDLAGGQVCVHVWHLSEEAFANLGQRLRLEMQVALDPQTERAAALFHFLQREVAEFLFMADR